MSDAYNIPAKQVLYHGIMFRSKLEARWAVILDAIGIKWEYEPEKFVGNNGIDYMPDFYFPDYNLYAEVKATDAQLFESEERISAAIDYGATPIGTGEGLLLLGPVPYHETLTWGYALHGKFLYWDKGVCLSDFYILPDIAVKTAQLFPATIWLNKTMAEDISSYAAIPKQSTVKNELIEYSHLSVLHLGLLEARRARFDFDDNFEKMFAEGRHIIGGSDKQKIPATNVKCEEIEETDFMTAPFD